MPQPNMKCKVCGAEYYICALGLEKTPYKSIVCSSECYDKWVNLIDNPKSKPNTLQKKTIKK